MTVDNPLWKHRIEQGLCFPRDELAGAVLSFCWALGLGIAPCQESTPGLHAQGIAYKPIWISFVCLSYQGIVSIFSCPSRFSVHWRNIKKLLHITHLVHENCVGRSTLTEFLHFQ